MDKELIRSSLNNAGFTDVQSEILSHILAQMATKEDLRILRAELRADISSMRSDLLAVVERTARETQAQMTKTMVGLIISLATIFTLLDLFYRLSDALSSKVTAQRVHRRLIPA